MKKIFLISVLFVITMNVSAQYGSSEGGFRLGLTAGINFSNMSIKEDGKDVGSNYSAKTGFKIGAIAEYAFNDYFALSPELVFTQRGFKEKISETYMGYDVSGEGKLNINYLQLPVNVIVMYPVSDDFKIMGIVGPYFAYALSGKVTAEGTAKGNGVSSSTDSEEKLKFGSGEDEVKPSDIGLTIGAGVEFYSFFFRVQYELGLGNLSNDEYSTVRNRNFGLSIGYLFSF